MRTGWLAAGLAAGVALATPVHAIASIPRGRFGIGDSIMLSAKPELGGYGIRANAKVGRQFDQGLGVVRRMVAAGTLPKRVIVHLGTNGWIDQSSCGTLLEEVGHSRRVFLVTIRVPRGWMRSNNRLIRACAASNEKIEVIRWAMVSGRHPEWFADDGYHLNADGQAAFAAYVDAQVDAILAALRSTPSS